MEGDRVVSDAENVSEIRDVAAAVADAVAVAIVAAGVVSGAVVGWFSPTLTSTSKGTSRKLPKRIFSLAKFFRIVVFVVVVDERLEVEADPDSGRDVANEPNR